MEDVRFFFGSGLRLSFGVTAAIYGLYYAFGPVLLTLFIKEANLFPVAYDALGCTNFPLWSVRLILCTYAIFYQPKTRLLLL